MSVVLSGMIMHMVNPMYYPFFRNHFSIWATHALYTTLLETDQVCFSDRHERLVLWPVVVKAAEIIVQ